MWFAVRCLYEVLGSASDGDLRHYEERITLWRRDSVDEAIAAAETEAMHYAADMACRYLQLAQAYELPGVPGDGQEVFSLIRTSPLAATEYLGAFFDTGGELQAE